MARGFTVVVGNVGTVHETTKESDALFSARCYVDRSKSGRGRCAGEPVTVLDPDGEIIAEYIPDGDDDEHCEVCDGRARADALKGGK